MKNKLHSHLVILAAFLGAAGWFALWLLAFDPAPVTTAEPKPVPAAIRLLESKNIVRPIQSSRVFAAPSAEGFGQGFLGTRIEMRPILESPVASSHFLPRHTFETPPLDRSKLREQIITEKQNLPVPGATEKPVRPAPAPVEFFFDPVLQPRVPVNLALDVTPAQQLQTFRIRLTIESNGRVSRAFFDTPAPQNILLAVRALQFKPAANVDEGWLELRLNTPQPEELNNDD